MTLDVDLTVPQTEFFQSTAKATAAVAGFGSGKTQGTIYRLFATMLQYPKADMLYSAPTVPLIRDIFWSKLDEFLPSMNLKYSINKSEGIVYVDDHGRIFCRSMDNPQRLVGFEVLDAFLDELDILPLDKGLEVYRKVKARMRQKNYSPKFYRLSRKKQAKKSVQEKYRKKNQLWVTTTPEGFKSTYELFKKNPIKDSHLVQMSTYSNPHLPEDYIEDLLNSYPPQLIKAYLNGEFVNLTQSPVWQSFHQSYNSAPNYVKQLQLNNTPLNESSSLVVGMDFNVGRGCAVVYHKTSLPAKHPNNPTPGKPYQILVAIKEIVDTYDTPETIETLRYHFPKSLFPRQIVVPDASGNNRKSTNATVSDISLLKKAGFIVKKRNKNPNIKDRITAANAAFNNAKNNRRVYVDTVACPTLTEALIQQTYNKNDLPEKGRGKGDDVTDAATYPLYYYYPVHSTGMYTAKVGGL